MNKIVIEIPLPSCWTDDPDYPVCVAARHRDREIGRASCRERV